MSNELKKSSYKSSWFFSSNAKKPTQSLKHSIELHGKDGQDKHTSIDTTVQEKHITYLTDAKLHKQIIDKYVGIAKKEKLPLRRSYSRTAKELVRATYNGTHPKRKKKAS